MDLDAKFVLSNKLVDELKCENESLKMQAKCLVAELIAKKDENICCNHVVVSNFMPIVCSTSKEKSVYIPLRKRNQKVCHHCGVIGHIRPQCPKLREQNHIVRSFPKKPIRPKHIVCHHFGVFGHLRPHCSKFQVPKRIKSQERLELLGSCALQAKPVLRENGKLLKKFFDVLTSLSMFISDSNSSNLRLTSHETLIPNNRFVWMRKSFYG